MTTSVLNWGVKVGEIERSRIIYNSASIPIRYRAISALYRPPLFLQSFRKPVPITAKYKSTMAQHGHSAVRYCYYS